MTEHDDPTNADSSDGNTNTDRDRPSDEDATWFRTHVDPVVGGDVPDAWDEIRSRATGQQRLLIPLPTAPAKTWPGRRLVAVAALLLVTVGLIGVGLKLVGSDDDDQRPAGSGDGATGFYVPGELPSGWMLTDFSVAANPGETAVLDCPCNITEVSVDSGHGGYIAVTTSGDLSTFFGADPSPLALDNRSAWYVEDGGIRTVVWRTANGSRAIASTSLDRVELVALAEDWTSDKPPVLDGYSVTDSWSRDQPIDTVHGTLWSFSNETSGQHVHVIMGPEVFSSGVLVSSTVTLPGNGLPLGILPDSGFVGAWPGRTEIFGSSLSDATEGTDQPTPPADAETIEAILGSFQPVDASTWSDYLASAPLDETQREPQDRNPLRTDRIGDWLVGPEPGTAPPQPKVQVVQNDPDDPAAVITVESDVDFVSVAEGEPFSIELTMTNRTGAALDVSGCSFGGVIWSLIDEQGLATPAGGVSVDCDPGPYPWLDGEQRTRTFEFPGWGPMPDEGPIAAVIQYGDNLSEGVTVVVPGEVGG